MDLDQDPGLPAEVPQEALLPVPTPSLAATEASDIVREAVAPQRLAKRRDAPVVAHTTGAKRNKSTSLLPTGQRAQLLGKLREKNVARSSAGSYCSHMRAWLRLHRRWFGVDVPLIPITPLKIEAVASQLSHLRYRSFANNLASAKRAHVLSPFTDGSWGENLKLTGRDCTRAVTRGIGPAKQCAVFEGGLAAVLALKLGAQPLVSKGPIGPINLVVLGSYFLLREMEASLMLIGSVHLDLKTEVVWVHLASSKTDPQALSVWRHWGCVCSPGFAPPALGCPYHAALGQAELVKQLAERMNLAKVDVPFFPTARGKVVAKERVASTFESIATRLGEPLRDVFGRKRFTGHLLRVLGARGMSAAGIELFKIQVLAMRK